MCQMEELQTQDCRRYLRYVRARVYILILARIRRIIVGMLSYLYPDRCP
jgi:hypothetical protein